MLSPSGFNDPELEDMWYELQKISLYEDDEGELLIAENWRWFPAMTSIKEIWDWFDKEHSMGVNWLMYELNNNRR